MTYLQATCFGVTSLVCSLLLEIFCLIMSISIHTACTCIGKVREQLSDMFFTGAELE